MKIYLAAMYGKMQEMQRVANELIKIGNIVTSRWINGDEEIMTKSQAAQMDLDDIDNADCLVLFTNPIKTMFTGGGRCVEFGYAIARKKRCIIVGDYENVFCHLDNVEVYSDLSKMLENL